MSRDDPQMKLRLPEQLKDRIAAAADASGRSMNAEILARLSASFEHGEGKEDTVLAEVKAALAAEKAVTKALTMNFEVLANILAGPAGENKNEVLRVMASLRILGTTVPK